MLLVFFNLQILKNIQHGNNYQYYSNSNTTIIYHSKVYLSYTTEEKSEKNERDI